MSGRPRFLRRSAAVLACLAIAACGADLLPPTAGLSKDTVASGGAYPSVTAKAREETPTPFGDPTATTTGGREVIEAPTSADIFAPSPLPEMSWGAANAPLTIVQYASLTCPHCRHFHVETFPAFKKTYIDTGKVRFVLREFPIGKQSGNATIALRCAAPDKYLDLYGKFMAQQANWVSQEVRLDPIFAVAKQAGLKREQFDACLKDEKLIENLKWVKDRGRKLGIIGTPNYFVGDKLVKKELTMADIAAYVEGRPPPATAAATAAPSAPAQ